ncbi:hypothetical protein, partial [Streptomyces tendae]
AELLDNATRYSPPAAKVHVTATEVQSGVCIESGDLVDVRLRDGRRPGRLPGTELLHRVTDRVEARAPELWPST